MHLSLQVLRWNTFDTHSLPSFWINVAELPLSLADHAILWRSAPDNARLNCPKWFWSEQLDRVSINNMRDQDLSHGEGNSNSRDRDHRIDVNMTDPDLSPSSSTGTGLGSSAPTAGTGWKSSGGLGHCKPMIGWTLRKMLTTRTCCPHWSTACSWLFPSHGSLAPSLILTLYSYQNNLAESHHYFTSREGILEVEC